MEALNDPEEMILCPYNPAHHIRRCRMAVHLVKCKKNYPDCRLVECDFNSTHKIPEVELQYHHENCPDRRNIEIHFYEEEGSEVDKFPITKVEIPTGGECWDDCNVPTYNPKIHCEKNEIIRHMDVESKAKKKDFRMAERRRLNNLAEASSSEYKRKMENLDITGMPKVTVRTDLPEPKRTFTPTGQQPEAPKPPTLVTDIMKRIKFAKAKAAVPE